MISAESQQVASAPSNQDVNQAQQEQKQEATNKRSTSFAYLSYLLVYTMNQAYPTYMKSDKVLQYNVLNALAGKNEFHLTSNFEKAIYLKENTLSDLSDERRLKANKEIINELYNTLSGNSKEKTNLVALCYLNPYEKSSTFEHRVTFVQDPETKAWFFFTNTTIPKKLSAADKQMKEQLEQSLASKKLKLQPKIFDSLTKQMQVKLVQSVQQLESELQVYTSKELNSILHCTPFEIVQLTEATIKDYIENLIKFALELGGINAVWNDQVTQTFAKLSSTSQNRVERKELEAKNVSKKKHWFKPLLHMVKHEFDANVSKQGILSAISNAVEHTTSN